MFLALAWMAMLGVVGSARAGQITQTFTSPAATVPYTVTFMANQFNMPGETLNSVEIEVTSTITGTISVINISQSAQTFSNATSSVPVSLSGPGGLALGVTATTSGQSGTIAAAPANGFTKETLDGNSVTGSVTTTLVPPNLGPYIGSGMATLPFTFSAGSGTFGGSSSANGSVFFGGSATASANVTLIYNFTAAAVPEPASMGLLGIGMAGFFAFRRFFDKRAAKV
jgi:hypothetical protein